MRVSDLLYIVCLGMIIHNIVCKINLVIVLHWTVHPHRILSCIFMHEVTSNRSPDKYLKTSSPNGNDRSPESKQVFLNSSLVSTMFLIGQGQLTLQSMFGPNSDLNQGSQIRCKYVKK